MTRQAELLYSCFILPPFLEKKTFILAKDNNQNNKFKGQRYSMILNIKCSKQV